MNAISRRLAALTLALATLVPASVTAQPMGYYNTGSYSNSYSQNWGRSTSLGPGGFNQSGYNNQSYRGSQTQSVGGFGPFGGFDRTRTANVGYDQNNHYSRGVAPGVGIYNNVGGSFNQFQNGSNAFRIYGW